MHGNRKIVIGKMRTVVIITSIFFSLCTYSFLTKKHKLTSSDDFIGRYQINPDKLDYAIIAANFALTNQFPVSGYILDTSAYKVKTYWKLNHFFLDVFKENGSVTTLARPPLYPLFVGYMYKVLGYKIYYNQLLNILLLAFITGCMPFVGYQVWGRIGYIAGVFAASIYMTLGFDNLEVYSVDIQLFITIVFFFIFWGAISIKPSSQPPSYLKLGLLIGVGLLTKPIMVMMPFLYLGYFAVKYPPEQRKLLQKRILFLFAGIIIVILPYTIFINIKQISTKNQREAWIERVAQSRKMDMVNDWKDYPPCKDFDSDTCDNFKLDFTKSILITHSSNASFMCITNSGGEQLLHQNNEKSLDGAPLHFEWMFVKNSKYNQDTFNRNTFVKILSFYRYYPSYIFKIPIARIIYSAKTYPLIFWLAGALWGLSVIQRRATDIKNYRCKTWILLTVIFLFGLSYYLCFVPFKYASVLYFLPLFLVGVVLFKKSDEPDLSIAYPILWLSIFLLLILIFGDERFTWVAMPVSCLCGTYFSLNFIKVSILGVLNAAKGSTAQP